MVKKILLLIAVSYTIFITVVSFINIHGIPKLGSSFDDKVYHTIAYSILAFLWVVYIQKPENKKTMFLVCIAVVAFGIVIEFLQHRINPNRTFDVYDILANTIGSILGTLIAASLKVIKLK